VNLPLNSTGLLIGICCW